MEIYWDPIVGEFSPYPGPTGNCMPGGTTLCCRCSHSDLDVNCTRRRLYIVIESRSVPSWRHRPLPLTLGHVETQALHGNTRCHLRCWRFNLRNEMATQVQVDCEGDLSTPLLALPSLPQHGACLPKDGSEVARKRQRGSAAASQLKQDFPAFDSEYRWINGPIDQVSFLRVRQTGACNVEFT